MKKFCCEMWNSSVKYLQDVSSEKIDSNNLIYDAQIEFISLWGMYCPACGLLTSEKSVKLIPAQPTRSSICSSCKGTGFAGGKKDSKVKCLVCIGTGKIKPKKDITDTVIKTAELMAKIKKDNKPLREDAKPENIK